MYALLGRLAALVCVAYKLGELDLFAVTRHLCFSGSAAVLGSYVLDLAIGNFKVLSQLYAVEFHTFVLHGC